MSKKPSSSMNPAEQEVTANPAAGAEVRSAIIIIIGH
jgi:hypothetical protein